VLQTVDVAVMQLKDLAENVDAATTAVCGSFYFSAAVAVSEAATVDAADAETTAACGSSCSSAAVAAETSSVATAAANH
jgi:hypothetical protein